MVYRPLRKVICPSAPEGSGSKGYGVENLISKVTGERVGSPKKISDKDLEQLLGKNPCQTQTELATASGGHFRSAE